MAAPDARCGRTACHAGPAGRGAAVPGRHRLGFLVPAAGRNGPRAGSRQARRRVRAAARAPAPAGAAGTADAHRARHLQQGGRRGRIRRAAPSRWSASTPSCRPSPGSTTRRRIKASYAAPSVHQPSCASAGEVLRPGETESTYSLARDLQQPVFSQPAAGSDGTRPAATAHSADRPGPVRRRDPGRILDRRPAALRRAGRGFGASTRWRCSTARAGCSPATRCRRATRRRSCCPGPTQANEYEVPVSPVGNGLVHPRAGLPHLAGRDRQRPVLAGRRAERA